MSAFERYLTVWVLLCIGIALGQGLPAHFRILNKLEVARVNLPVGLLIWGMIIPMLIEVPAMLLVVKVVNSSKEWYERG